MLVCAAWLMVASAPRPACAHPGVSTTALLKVDSQRRITLTIAHDALALALNDQSRRVSDEAMFALMAESDAAVDAAFREARGRFLRDLELSCGDLRLPCRLVTFPAAVDVRRWQTMHPEPRLPIKLDIVAMADVPMNARSVSVLFPDVLAEVILTVDRVDMQPLGMPIMAGDRSPDFELPPASLVENQPPATSTARAALQRPAFRDESLGSVDVAWRYVVLGFEHIIPDGLDHALFVLGLFLLTPRFRPLLWQVTAFTVAHSATLILSTFGWVRLPMGLVEPAIAGSIAFVALENITRPTPSAWRPTVAFLFGLLHGLGFASALGECGLPTNQLILGVLAFNVGVEVGHLLVLAAAFGLLGWWRTRPWYRARLARPLSIGIGGVALYWMLERLA